jgi:hypothetical protein
MRCPFALQEVISCMMKNNVLEDERSPFVKRLVFAVFGDL